MSRIADCFARLRGAGRRALVPYITAGDPTPEMTLELMHALVEAGADVIELGVPFSDPMADGPVIQAACERALAHHVTLTQILTWVGEFRQTNTHTPVVLMGYLNPIEAMGYQSFADQAQQVGVDGVLVVDLPPEEAHDWLSLLRERALDPIFLLSPTTNTHRIQYICEQASGFVYYVSLKGVTGAQRLDADSVAQKVKEIRQLTTLPVGVGFGINDAAAAARVAKSADAVVVGSAIVRLMGQYAGQRKRIIEEVTCLVESMRKAIDSVGNGAE